MPLSDIITAPFLISLGITLLLVGIMVVFIMQRFQEQNHKISSMFGLVSSMAEEMNYMRGKLQSVTFTSMHPSQRDGIGTGGGVVLTSASDKLIDVSDGEEDSGEDSGDDSEGDSDSDSDSDSDEDSDSDGEDSDNEAKVMCTHKVIDICADDILANLTSTIKVINISENFTINDTLSGADIDINDEIDELSSEDSSSSDSSSDDEDDLEEQDHVPINTSISISAEKLNTLDLLKSIHISNLEETNKEFAVLDYKKMSLNKLRSIVVEKGIATSAAKLKKEELLKLLSVAE
jgi:hypothetical protein